jgi:thymidylate synthase
MQNYLDLLREILKKGVEKKTRNGKTKSLFVRQLRFNLKEGFPALTTKKLSFNLVLSELLWMIEGSGNERRLSEILHGTCDKSKKTIWTANAKDWAKRGHPKFKGDLGRIYGVQWRNWINQFGEKTDQLKEVIERIKKDPNDRRLIVSAWNPGELKYMALPPCHRDFQFYIADGKISLHMNQRSCDMFLGVPFNIASYSILLHMVAQETGYKVGEAVFTFNDAHIYKEHYEAVEEQLKRAPGELPKIWLNPDVKSIFDFKMDDVKLVDYNPQASIKAKMVV